MQGAGDVGAVLIDLLAAAGADVIFSEVDPDLIARHRDVQGFGFVAPEAVFDAECDVLVPCALGGVLDAGSIPRLRCRIVAGCANNQLATSSDADRLRAKGVLYAPDFVINVGGAMASTGIETMGWTAERAGEQVRRYVGETLTAIFEEAERSGSSTAAAAVAMAERHLQAAEPR